MCRLFIIVSYGFEDGLFHDGNLNLPRRLVLIIAATAPNFDNAYNVTTISGEFVVKTPMKSPDVTPRA